jgi:hypothetical protein
MQQVRRMDGLAHPDRAPQPPWSLIGRKARAERITWLPERAMSRAMSRAITVVAAALLAACGDASSSIAPESLTLTIVAPTAVTGEFGEAVPVSVLVADEGGGPHAGATVTFAAEGGGSVSPVMVTTDASGVATSLWTLATVTGPQNATATVAGGRVATFTASAANGWKVGASATLTYAERLADPGVTFGRGTSWSTTRLGSAPLLAVGCSQGSVVLVVLHRNLVTLDGNVVYSLDDAPRVGEAWLERPPEYAILGHPGPASATAALVKRMASARTFNITFRHYEGGEVYAPNFTMAGLSLVLPQVMAGCPGVL